MPHRRPTRLATLPAVALAAVALVAAGCVVAASPAPSAPGSSPPTSGSPTGFYLRAWTTQALPPEAAFAMAPRLAISDGVLLDTAVAIPAIYPGPLLVEPYARPISAHGIETIVAALRSGGLLVSRDFTGGTPLAGGPTAHLEVVVDGTTYRLSGDPTRVVRCAGSTRCVPDPGTAEAFAAFWQQLTGDPAGWLGTDLGAETSYGPERLALLVTPPVAVADGLIKPGSETWPFAPFSKFGVAYGTSRCGVVSGADTATLLPILRRSNQITRFADSTGSERSLVVRVLLPGEPDPCTGSPDDGSPAPGSPSAAPSPSGLVPGASGGSGGSGGGASGGSTGLGLPVVLGVGCSGAGPAFPASALAGTGTGTAEGATDEPAAVLRALLADGSADAAWLPATGWRRVLDTPTTVLFVAPARDGPDYVSVEVDRSASGTWTRAGWGTCRPMTVLADPFGPATWQLAAPVAPTDTRFTALVTELACASGTEPTGRVSEPLIRYETGTVTVTFGVRRLEGAQTCPSNPPLAVEVVLDQPLGSRALLDGALYPASQVEVANPS